MRWAAERSFFAVLVAISVTLLAVGFFAVPDADEPAQIVLADDTDEFVSGPPGEAVTQTPSDYFAHCESQAGSPSGNATPLERYFAKLDAVECEGTWRDVLNSTESRVATTSQIDPIAMLRTVFLEPALINRAYAADLRAIDAPPEVQDAHRKLILAREESAAAYEAFARRLDGVKDPLAAAHLFDDEVPGATEAGNKEHAACLDLVSIAERYGVETHLECTQLHFVVLTAQEPPEDLLEAFPGEP